MIFKVQDSFKMTKTYKDNENNIWKFIESKEFKKRDKTQQIILGDFKGVNSNNPERVLVNGDIKIGVYEYRNEKKWNEKVIGYIPVIEENTQTQGFIRILRKDSLKPIITALFLIFVLIALFIAGFLLAERQKVPGLDKTAVAYEVNTLVNKDPDQISIPGLKTINATEGETHVKQVLANPNGNPCYFKFRIFLKETDELLYESGLVEPGKAVMEFDMQRTFDFGKYPIQIRISTLDIKDGKTALNGGVIEGELNVLYKAE